MKNTIEFNHDLDWQNMFDKMPYIIHLNNIKI